MNVQDVHEDMNFDVVFKTHDANESANCLVPQIPELLIRVKKSESI